MTLTEEAWHEAALRDAGLAQSERRARGVVHTPPEVARFVARAALDLCAQELGEAVCSAGVVVLDPAVGTGMFPAAALEVTSNAGPAPRLSRIVAFDVDPGALERAARVLRPAADAARVPLSLEAGSALLAEPRVPGVPVILGNPPWAGKSESRGAASSEALLEDFRRDDAGVSLGERKIGVLSDDYVRFVRWSVEVLRRAPAGGVLGLVTNASWLDGPVHRGMRAALLRWLDEIVLVDLGGSALVSRRAGERDQNVFPVRPGAVLVLGVRRPGAHEPRRARVRHARLGGSRDQKLATLGAGSLASLALAPLTPVAPHFALVPRRAVSADYSAAPSIAEWMPFHREGVQTNRDDLAVDTEPARLRARLSAFAAGTLPGAEMPSGSAHFDVALAQAELGRALGRAEHEALGEQGRAPGDLCVPIAYRPLDARVFVAHPSVCHRARADLRAALARSELAIVTTRKDRGGLPFRHLAITDAMVDNCFLSARSSCRARAFPTHDADGEPNVGPEVAARLREIVGRAPPPRAIATYLAAFLGAPSYQCAFDEILRVDYARVPFPASAAELAAVARAGEALVAAWIGPIDSAAPLDPRALGLVVGHHRVIERLRRERPALEKDGLARASAIVRAQDACDAAIREPLARLCAGAAQT